MTMIKRVNNQLFENQDRVRKLKASMLLALTNNERKLYSDFKTQKQSVVKDTGKALQASLRAQYVVMLFI